MAQPSQHITMSRTLGYRRILCEQINYKLLSLKTNRFTTKIHVSLRFNQQNRHFSDRTYSDQTLGLNSVHGNVCRSSNMINHLKTNLYKWKKIPFLSINHQNEKKKEERLKLYIVSSSVVLCSRVTKSHDKPGCVLNFKLGIINRQRGWSTKREYSFGVGFWLTKFTSFWVEKKRCNRRRWRRKHHRNRNRRRVCSVSG